MDDVSIPHLWTTFQFLTYRRFNSSPIDDVDDFTEEERGSRSAREARRHEAGVAGEIRAAVAAGVETRPSQVLQVDATHATGWRTTQSNSENIKV